MRLPAILVSLCALQACAHQQANETFPLPDTLATCLELVYRPADSVGEALPALVALNPLRGADSAQAFWAPPEDTSSRVWQMFYFGATWRPRPPDSLVVLFSNGFSGVRLAARVIGDSLVGKASWLSDVEGGGFHVPFSGHQRPCRPHR